MSDLFLLGSCKTDASRFLRWPPGRHLTQRAGKNLGLRCRNGGRAARRGTIADSVTDALAHPCSWAADEWEHCTKTCGASGYQLRTVRCLQPLHDGTNRSVNSKYCAGERPESRRPCNRVPCPAQWKTGPWNEVRVRTLSGRGGGAGKRVCGNTGNSTLISLLYPVGLA